MQKTADIVLSAGILAAGLALLGTTFSEAFDVRTFGGDVGPAFAPRLFLSVWVGLAALALFNAIRSEAPEDPELQFGQLAAVVCISVLATAAMTWVGFYFAMVPGMALFLWAFGYRKPLPLALISVLSPLIIWALFNFGFELLLPRSPWFYSI